MKFYKLQNLFIKILRLTLFTMIDHWLFLSTLCKHLPDTLLVSTTWETLLREHLWTKENSENSLIRDNLSNMRCQYRNAASVGGIFREDKYKNRTLNK